MLFICHRIFEQHNNITMCDYIISLNEFNNITHNITHSMIFSLYILHLSGDRHFQCRISPLEISTPFLFTSLSHFRVAHYSQILSTPTNITVCLLFQTQFYTPNITVTGGIQGAICLWWKYLLHHNMFICLPCDRIRKILGIRLGPTSHLESDCIIQDHHISDTDQTRVDWPHALCLNRSQKR